MPYLRAVLLVLVLSCAGFPCPSVAADAAAANSQYQVPKVGDSEESVLARFGPVKGRLPLPDGKLMLSFAVGDVIIKSGFVIDVPYLDVSAGLSSKDRKDADLRALETEINRRLIEYRALRSKDRVRYYSKSFDLEARGFDSSTGVISFFGRSFPPTSTSLYQMVFFVDAAGFGYFAFYRYGIQAPLAGSGFYSPIRFSRCGFAAGNDRYLIKALGYEYATSSGNLGTEHCFFEDQKVFDKLSKYGAGIDFYVSGGGSTIPGALTGLERKAFRDGMSLLELIRRKNRILYGSDFAPSSQDDEPVAGDPKPPGEGRAGSSFGSGMVFSNGGHFFTNHHVIEKGKRHFIVRIVDGKLSERFEAELLFDDPKNDLAILRAKTWTPQTYGEVGPPVIAPTSDCKLGSQVFVLGFPLPGLVSSNVKYTKGDVSDLAGMDDDKTIIQHTAQIQPGNSGGPMCLMDGRVIGIVVSSIGVNYVLKQTGGALPQGVNFSIKSDVLLGLIKSGNISLPAPKPSTNPVEHVRAYTVQVMSER